jgi:hypothetical protein
VAAARVRGTNEGGGRQAAGEGNPDFPKRWRFADSLEGDARMQNVIIPREAERAPPVRDGAVQFDYAEPSELFTRRDSTPKRAAGRSQADADRARSRATYRNALAYRRFASGAEAIRFAIEDLLPAELAATVLVVSGDRHDPAAIRALYASAAYPLRRRGGEY